MTRILLVEDSGAIVLSLTDFLRGEGFSVTAVPGQAAAEAALARNETDLLLVDLRLADGRGQDVCAAAREQDLPVIILTAADDEASVVSCLDMGADDYITKPFGMRELIARIKANIRRVDQLMERSDAPSDVKSFGPVSIDMNRYEVRKGEKALELTLREFELLKYLAEREDRVFSREQLLEEVWGYEYYGDIRTVDVTVRRLREKLEDDPADPKYIITKRGIGYYFTTKHQSEQ